MILQGTTLAGARPTLRPDSRMIRIPKRGTPMGHLLTNDEIRLLTEEFYAAWNRRDPAGIVAFATEDVEFWGPPLDPVRRGREEIQTMIAGFFRAMPDMTVEVVGDPMVSLDRTRVAVEWRTEGTFTGPMDPPGLSPTGTLLHDHGVDVLELEEGKIHRWVMAFDMMGLARQAGAVPVQGSMADRMGLRMQRRTAARMRKRAASR